MTVPGKRRFSLLNAALLATANLISTVAIAANFESALQFSGTTAARDHVEIPEDAAFNFTDAVTIETWVNISGSGDDWEGLKWAPLVGKGNAWAILRYLDTNRLTFRTDADGVLGAEDELLSVTELAPNRWYHVAAVYSKATGKKELYLDGVLDASAPYSRSFRTGPEKVRFAANSEDPNAVFGGTLDDTRIWSTARSAQEIADNRERFIAPGEPGLAGVWHFQEDLAQPTLALDSSGLGRDGLLVGRALPVFVAGRPHHLALGLNQGLAEPQFACVPATQAAFDTITKGITLEAWVKLDEVPSTQATVVSKGANVWQLSIGTSGRAQFKIGGAAGAEKPIVSSAHFPIGEWAHLAGSYDSVAQRITIYINGFPSASESADLGVLDTNDNPVLFGAEPTGPDPAPAENFLEGAIDEVRLWSAALSAGQVRDNHFRLLNGNEPGLVAQWRFNEAGPLACEGPSPAPDNSLNATLKGDTSDEAARRPTGVPSAPATPPQFALDFDGVEETVTVPHDPMLDLTGSFTIEAWVHPDSGKYQVIVAKGSGGWAVALDENNFLLYLPAGDPTNPDRLISDRPLPNREWHHVAVSVDTAAGTTEFCIDGQPAGAHDVGSVGNNTGPLTIGSQAGDPAGFFEGQIDEVRLWQPARGKEEIELYALQPLPSIRPPGLAAYYDFNDGRGLSLSASSGTPGPDGTLNNNMDDSNWRFGHAFAGTSLIDAANLTATPDSAGLWIGQIVVGKVTVVHSAGLGDAIDVPQPAGGSAQLRVLLHVDQSGRPRLLKDVIIMRTLPEEAASRLVLLTDPGLISSFEGVQERDGKNVGLRYSTAAFDFEERELSLVGGVGPGVSCAGRIDLAPTHPTNPYRHKFHPDHPAGFDVGRSFAIEFDNAPLDDAPGFGTQQLTGRYAETLTGLHKVPIRVEGTIRITRISHVHTLNQ